MLVSAVDLVWREPRRQPGAEQLECAGPQLVLATAGAAWCAPSAWSDPAGDGALACARSPTAAGQLQVMGLGSVVGQCLGRDAPAAHPLCRPPIWC
jgi:hypothetical protein